MYGSATSAAASFDAPVDVSGADHDRDLDAAAVHLHDLGGDGADALWIEPVLLLAHHRLARELQQHSVEGRRGFCRRRPGFCGNGFGHSANA